MVKLGIIKQAAKTSSTNRTPLSLLLLNPWINNSVIREAAWTSI